MPTEMARMAIFTSLFCLFSFVAATPANGARQSEEQIIRDSGPRSNSDDLSHFRKAKPRAQAPVQGPGRPDLHDCESGWPAVQVIDEGDYFGGPTFNVGVMTRLNSTLDAEGAGQTSCTASWIASDLVVTAAHCIYRFSTGKYYYQDEFDGPGRDNTRKLMYVVASQTHELDSFVYYYRVVRSFIYTAYMNEGVGDIAVLQLEYSRPTGLEYKFAWRPILDINEPRVVVGYPGEAGIVDGYSRIMDFIFEGKPIYDEETGRMFDIHATEGGMSGGPIIQARREVKAGAPQWAIYAVNVAALSDICYRVWYAVGGRFSLARLVEAFDRSISSSGDLYWVNE